MGPLNAWHNISLTGIPFTTTRSSDLMPLTGQIVKLFVQLGYARHMPLTRRLGCPTRLLLCCLPMRMPYWRRARQRALPCFVIRLFRRFRVVSGSRRVSFRWCSFLHRGPRSVSDLQVHLEALRHSRGVPVFCAYVDTLANTPFADVGLRDNISFWLDLILSGRVCAVIALSGRSIWHSSDHPQAFRCKQRFWGALTLPEIQHENVERDNDFLQMIFLVHKTCQQSSVACMSIAPLPDTPEECNFMDEPRICELFQDNTHCFFHLQSPTTI